MNDRKDILKGPFGAFYEFLGAAFFGLLLSLVVFLSMIFLAVESFFAPPWIHLLWIIPLAWGIIGVTWFDQILDLGKKILDGFLEAISWY